MATFTQADGDVIDLVNQTMRQYHRPLADAGVTMSVLMAYARTNDAGEPIDTALKHHGYPAFALIKINSYSDRVEGLPDATLKLDGDQWPDLNKDRQVALLDHELNHLVLVRDNGGRIKLDDCGRPRLKMRLHDLVMGGFSDVVERHKENAAESEAFADINRKMTQLRFPWGLT